MATKKTKKQDKSKKTLVKTEAAEIQAIKKLNKAIAKIEAKGTKEPREPNNSPLVVVEAKSSNGTTFQKQFRANLIPVACVIVTMLDKSIHVLAWTISQARATSHVNRVTRLYIDKKSGVFVEQRYLAVEMTTSIKQVKELVAREDRTAFKVAKKARLEAQAKKAEKKSA